MENTLKKWVDEKKKLHFTLIDPEKQKPEEAGELALKAESFGTNAIMVGGSTIEGTIVDDTVKAIKNSSSLPTILFPSTAKGVSPNSDYIFWMMLLNSMDRRFLIGEQMKAAIPLSTSNIKPIPMGYIVISTSSKPTEVEKVGQVDKIGVGDIEKALSYALTAEYYGMHCIYLEAGSGAQNPVPVAMIAMIKDKISIPLIVGGGIRDPDTAKKIADAGADIIVTGTIAENDPEKLGEIIKAINPR